MLIFLFEQAIKSLLQYVNYFCLSILYLIRYIIKLRYLPWFFKEKPVGTFCNNRDLPWLLRFQVKKRDKLSNSHENPWAVDFFSKWEIETGFLPCASHRHLALFLSSIFNRTPQIYLWEHLISWKYSTISRNHTFFERKIAFVLS